MSEFTYFSSGRKNLIQVRFFITRWPRSKKVSRLMAPGSYALNIHLFNQLYVLMSPGLINSLFLFSHARR